MALISQWHHQFIETNKVRLHCVTQGEGNLVILLHSYFEFWYSWRHQLSALAKYCKVVVPDLRGCNDSEKPTSGYDLDTISHDIDGLIKALGYTQADVVGHAWGGTIAWQLASTMPDSVRRLAILNGVHPHQFRKSLIDNLDQLRRSWRLLAVQIPNIPEWLIEQTLPELVQSFFQSHAVRKGAFPSEVTRLYLAALRKPGAIASALRYYRQLLAPPTWLSLLGPSNQPVNIPTLVLWGEDDSFFNLRLLESTADLVKAPLRIERIPQCGHWIQQEAPLTVNRELIQFLCK